MDIHFLVDQQLPPALARFLQNSGHRAEHVREIGLKDAHDNAVWHHASTEKAVVVSKDEDFYFLATVPGNTVRLLWVRIGNCRTLALVEKFKAQLPRVVAEFESGSIVVEIR